MLPNADSTSAYLYSIVDDFNVPREKISQTCLDIEIKSSAIAAFYEFCEMDTDEPDVGFVFITPLSAPDIITLDNIVAAHTGNCQKDGSDAPTEVLYPNEGESLVYDSTSQTWINQKVDHGNLKNLSNDDHVQYVPTDASRGMSADWNAGNVRITADGGFTKGQTNVDLASFANITGLLTGGELSINSGDNTLLDIAAGTGIHVDMSDRNNPHVHIYSWDAQTVDPQLAGTRSKWAGIVCSDDDSTAVISTSFSAEEKRYTIVLGRFWGTGGATITTTKNYATAAFSFGKSMEDIASVLGAVNSFGNNYYPSSVGLKLKRSAGRSFRFAANYDNNDLSPNIYDSVEANPQNVYQYHLRDSHTTISKSLIDPNTYDSTGIATAVPSGKWTVQRVYYFPVSNTTHIVYGQDIYDSVSLAYDGIIKNNTVLNNDILEGSILRAYLLLQEGCVDLENSNTAQIVKAYSDPGLVPGFTNHGQLGGLDDDDHPQYHNDARADVLYYRKDYIEQSANILYEYPNAIGIPGNVKTALDYNYVWQSDVGYSGRVSPEYVVVLDGTTDVRIEAGFGYVSDGDITKSVFWDSTTFINIGSLTQGVYYFYVDSNGVITYSTNFNESYDIIRLGSVVSSGLDSVISIVQCPCFINAAGNRVANTLLDLGPFIHNEKSGVLNVSSNNPLALTAGQADVHWALSNYILPELDTVDNLDNVYAIYKAADGKYYPEYYFINPFGGAGIFQGNRWNDVTQNRFDLVSGNFTFTQGSDIVTATGIDATAIIDDYYIFFENDGSELMNPIAIGGVDTTGATTVITLSSPYVGTGGTGNAYAVKALPRIPEGNFAKYLAVRLVDQVGSLYFVPGTEYFNDENDAKFSAAPDYPDYVKQFDLRIAYLIAQQGLTSWEGQIYDLRPLPFFREGGGSGSGGGAIISTHSEL